MERLTPLKAIRKRCLDCSETTTDIKNCPFDGIKDELCPLYPFRMGEGEGKGSRLRAIRRYCLWCVNESAQEVSLCPSTNCPLYPYRKGHNPTLKGRKGNPEALQRYRRILSERSASRENESSGESNSKLCLQR